MKQVLKLEYHMDAAHGWLKVPKRMVPTIARKMFSSYSYQDRQYLYLEEDCDMPKFLQTMENHGIPVQITDVDDGSESRIRLKQGLHEKKPRKVNLQSSLMNGVLTYV